MGGKPTPAVGFALGIERILLELESIGAVTDSEQPKSLYVASLGEPARLAAFSLIEKLLDEGIQVNGAVDRDGIGSQLARADKQGAKYALIIGQKEMQEGTVLLRDMGTGAQEVLSQSELAKELKERLGATIQLD